VEPDIKREENEVQGLSQQIQALRTEIQMMDRKINRQNRLLKNRDKKERLGKAPVGNPSERRTSSQRNHDAGNGGR